MSGELGSVLCQIVPEPISISICCLFPGEQMVRVSLGEEDFKAVAGVENFGTTLSGDVAKKRGKRKVA